MQISFTIPGKVGGKGRARSTLIKPKDKPAFISNYTPAKTRSEEAHVRSFAMAAMQGRKPLEGPLWLDIRVQLVPPPSWPKRKRTEAFWVTGKPDADNQVKLIADAANTVCWEDDAQIAVMFFARTFSLDGPEHVTVTFGDLAARQIEIDRPDWAPKDLPLFAGQAA